MRCFWRPVLQQFYKSLIIVEYVVSKRCVTVELTYVTSQDYVININDPRNTNDFIGHPLRKDSASAHGTPHPAWAPGPPPSKSGAG